MNASLLQTDSLTEQVQSLLAMVDRLRVEVDELRQETGNYVSRSVNCVAMSVTGKVCMPERRSAMQSYKPSSTKTRQRFDNNQKPDALLIWEA